MPRILADVYLEGGRNVRLPTTPGRSVQFTGGHAQIVDNLDMPHVLRMEGARVYPCPDAMPWAPEWLTHIDRIVAEVHWPEGWEVAHDNKQEWACVGPDSAVSSGEAGQSIVIGTPTSSEPVEPVDMTDRKGWIKPDDLLADPEPDRKSRRH